MFNQQIKGLVYLMACAIAAAFFGAAPADAGCPGHCPIDWNDSSEVTESDYLVGDPIGGFYAEWYICRYYPLYVPVLFPGKDCDDLDFNGDGVLDDDDLMGELSAVLDTEGFYVAWYIYMFYPQYVGVFMPEYECPATGTMCSPDLTEPVYAYVDDNLLNEVTRDGSLIGGVERATKRGFVVETAAFIAAPTSVASYEYLTGRNVKEIIGFSGDANIVLANVEYEVNGYTETAAAYYDRTTQVWTNLGYPEGDDSIASSCHFYTTGTGISENGNLIVGHTATSDNKCRYRPYVYNVSTGEFTIADVADGTAKAMGMVRACDLHANVLVGWSYDGPWGRTIAYWTRNSAGEYVQSFLAETVTGGEAFSISANGRYIGGKIGITPTIWTDFVPATVGDGTVEGEIISISDDGSIALGHLPGFGSVSNVNIFKDGAYTSYTDYLAAAGAPVGAEFHNATFPVSMSYDGKVIVGQGGSVFVPWLGFVSVVTP